MGKGKGLGGCLSKGLAKRAGDLLGFGLIRLSPAGQGFVGSGRSYDVQRSVGHEGGPQFGFKDGPQGCITRLKCPQVGVLGVGGVSGWVDMDRKIPQEFAHAQRQGYGQENRVFPTQDTFDAATADIVDEDRTLVQKTAGLQTVSDGFGLCFS